MPTPFPGMDPYLERPSRWHPFHTLLVSEIALTLAPLVAPKYYVSVEERTYTVSGEWPFVRRPDVAVIGKPVPSGEPVSGVKTVGQGHAVLVEVPELMSDYGILVSRGWQRPKALLFPFSIREPIPAIPIPLHQGEEEPTLDLNAVLHELYDRARFDLRIDYRQPPDPPLPPEDAEWAASLLTRQG